MNKRVRLTIAFILSAGLAIAQTGIKVHVIDKNTKQGIPFAAVGVEKNGIVIQSAQADIDGYAEIKPLDVDKYDVRVQYIGYHTSLQPGVQVTQDVLVRVDVEMESEMTKVDTTIVIGHRGPPIISTNTQQGAIVDSAGIQGRASPTINGIVANTPGVIVDNSGNLSFRGARPDATLVIVDGQKVAAGQENGGIPMSLVDQVSSITGGIPAKYGDVTGGVIEIHTIAGATKFFGSVQGLSSEMFDDFGYNDGSFSFGGPLLWKKDSLKRKWYPIIDFIVGGEYTYQKDASPNFEGDYYANSSTLAALEANPLTVNPLGGFNRSTELVTMSDIDHSNAIQNDASSNYQVNGKINYHINSNVKLTVGGSYQYVTSHDFENVYEVFNYNEDPLENKTNTKLFARLTQKFYTPDSKDKNALIKNANYSIQGEYSHYYDVIENSQFKDNLFDYGYVGQFNQQWGTTYTEKTGKYGNAFYETSGIGSDPTLYTFTPSSLNQIEANYTTDVYNALGQPNVTNPNTVEQNLGLLNGDRPGDVYSLWYNVGRAYPGYQKEDYNEFRFSAEFSAEIAHNSIEVGFEYQQDNLNYYSINAAGLWTIMRQITDYPQLAQLDTANPILQASKSGTLDYYNYNLLYNGTAQSQFDKSLRAKLGLAANSTNWIQTDDYAPSMYSLSMFSAADLLNNGNSLINYFGYDYKGDLQSSNPSIDDFFNKRDANGNLLYPQAAYAPIYMAGYIQDHFDIQNIVFDVGLRVDQFNANEPELKDPYLLYPAKTVAEVGSSLGEIPSNMGSNYVVYVNNSNDPTAIVGYRNGGNWYNAGGNLVTDPTVIASATTTGTIQPYLENPSQSSVAANAFTSYTPQVNIMPRIAFSFPITEKAKFFAHYDILTQRPPGVGDNVFQATNYLYMTSLVNSLGAPFQNPALQPQKTTDYELGFSQVLNEAGNMAITFSAFYREMRSLIDAYKYLDAYPVTYVAFDNIDFGTVKGFSVQYLLQQAGEWSDVKMTFGYNLQFATGTGSGPSDGYNLANSGEPNLQIPQPLSFDRRHTFSDNLDFHFGSGNNYDGPVWKTHKGKTVRILENAGFNVNFTANSGTPYTAQSTASQQGIGLQPHTGFVGSINGEYLPWQYNVDLRVDKAFRIMVKSHRCQLEVYIEATNLLNTENIITVYPYTGSATDDGFLASALGKQTTASQVSPQSFTDLYTIKELIQSPSYFSAPRQARLGAVFNF